MLYANGYPVGGGSSVSTEIIADDFDATSTYAVGDYCIYDGKLYKCTTAVSTAGQWDSTKWTETIVMDEVGGGGGTGGHTIIDENGTSMTARSGLQFTGCVRVTDDSTNNRTIIDILGGGFGDLTGWEEVGTATGNNPIDISDIYDDADEFIVVVLIGNEASQMVGTSFTKASIPSSNGRIGLGGEPNIALVEISPTAFTLTYARWTQVVTSTSVTKVYYKSKSGNNYFQPVIYSTEEREIGVWTDGKPLYEKTLAIPSLSAGSNTIQHNIANFDKMISCQGRINYDGDDLVVPYMQTQVTSGYVAYGIGISNFNSTRYFIILGNMFDVSKFSGGYVTVRYTKTTDVAGSGTWTPQGVPAHHYSTDEHVVGTWIDGSTLYEKTIDYTVNKSSSHTFNFADGNAKSVVDGFIINSLNSICFPVNCSWESKTEEFLYDETHFYINTSANIGNSSTLRIIVQYTKSS